MTAAVIRVGVVGLGAFGRHHARHYALNPGARLVAVVDPDIGRANAAAAEYGAEAFSDHRALIGKVDAVSIASPATFHYATARDLIDAGVHVLIEKPITTNSAEGSDLVRRAEASGVVLQVGHIERFSPAFAEMRRLVTTPRRIAAVRRTAWTGRSGDVDVVFDLMIHDIDLVLCLAEAPVVSVAASGAATRSASTDEAEGWLTFANGVIATLSASRVADENRRRLTVTEPATVFSGDFAGPSLSIAPRASRAPAEVVHLEKRDNLGAEIAAFLHSVATGAAPVVDGRAGVAALFIAERIQAAIAEGDATARRSM